MKVIFVDFHRLWFQKGIENFAEKIETSKKSYSRKSKFGAGK